MKKHSIAVSEEVYDYLKGMIDDEHVSNSDDSEERNANGETVAHRPSFSEVISHLIEDRESEPRSWQITDERKAAIGRAIESVVAADSDSEEQESEDVYTWRVLRDMLEEAA